MIDVHNLPDLVERCRNKSLPLITEEFGCVKSSNGHGSHFIQPVSSDYQQIIVHIEQDKLSSIQFWGGIAISFQDLIRLYGSFRKVYVPHDENFVYFFNEDDSAFSISTYTSADKEVVMSEYLANIEIRYSR